MAIYYEDQAAIHKASNPIFRDELSRTKHIKVDSRGTKELVKGKMIKSYVELVNQVGDIIPRQGKCAFFLEREH